MRQTHINTIVHYIARKYRHTRKLKTIKTQKEKKHTCRNDVRILAQIKATAVLGDVGSLEETASTRLYRGARSISLHTLYYTPFVLLHPVQGRRETVDTTGHLHT